METMLKSAVMNDIIAKHPMNGVRYTPISKGYAASFKKGRTKGVQEI